MQDEKPQFEFRNLPLLMIFNKSFFLQVWVDTSGARKKMKLNPGSYQKLLAENTTIDEMTMHSIQTGISYYCDTSYQTMQVYATRVVLTFFVLICLILQILIAPFQITFAFLVHKMT